jgi:flagellar biosynthesis component FlhA
LCHLIKKKKNKKTKKKTKKKKKKRKRKIKRKKVAVDNYIISLEIGRQTILCTHNGGSSLGPS